MCNNAFQIPRLIATSRSLDPNTEPNHAKYYLDIDDLERTYAGFQEFFRRCRENALCICVLGHDGSGKTSLINRCVYHVRRQPSSGPVPLAISFQKRQGLESSASLTELLETVWDRLYQAANTPSAAPPSQLSIDRAFRQLKAYVEQQRLPLLISIDSTEKPFCETVLPHLRSSLISLFFELKENDTLAQHLEALSTRMGYSSRILRLGRITENDIRTLIQGVQQISSDITSSRIVTIEDATLELWIGEVVRAKTSSVTLREAHIFFDKLCQAALEANLSTITPDFMRKYCLTDYFQKMYWK